MAAQSARKPIILPAGERASYTEALRAARNSGGLPTNVQIDDFLMARRMLQECANVPDFWMPLERIGLGTVWLRNGLAYPTTDRKFKKRRDIVDSFDGPFNLTWVLAASSVPSEAFATRGIGLFFEIQNLTRRGRFIVVETDPSQVVILEGFPQRAASWGRMDKKTRIPLEVKPKALAKLPEERKRRLLRLNLQGVRPLSRDLAQGGHWQDVYANQRTYLPFDVAHAMDLKPMVRVGRDA